MLETSIGYISCYRFDPSANDVPARENILEQYREICQRTQDTGLGRFVKYGEYPWPNLQFQSVDYSVSIDMWPAYIDYCFRNPTKPGDYTPYDSNPPPKPREDALSVLFDLCLCGDLSVILSGVVLLTDSRQSSRMPKSWGRRRCELMDSREEFVRFLMGTYHGVDPAKHPPEIANIPYFPGLSIEKGRYVYVEAGKKETSSKHFKAICNTRTPDMVLGSGGMMSEEAQIITPDGIKFYGYRAAGFGFEPFLRSAAITLDRMYGTIINFETFRRLDGVEYDISECDLKTKIEPNAGKVPKSPLAVAPPKEAKSGWVINEVELSSNLLKLEAGELELESAHYEFPEERSVTAIKSDCRKSFNQLREDFAHRFGPSIRSGTNDDSKIPLNGVFLFEVWKTGFGEVFLAASHEDRSLPVVLAFGKLHA